MPEDQRPTSAGRHHKEPRLAHKTRAALRKTFSKHRHRAGIQQNLQDSLRSPAISADDSHEIADSTNDYDEVQRNEGIVQTTLFYATVNTDGDTPRTAFTPHVGSTESAPTYAASDPSLWKDYREDTFAPDTAGSVTPYLPEGAITMTLCGTPRVVQSDFRSLLPDHIPATPINSFEIDVAGREPFEVDALARTIAVADSLLPLGLRPGGTSRVIEPHPLAVSNAGSNMQQMTQLNSREIIPPLPSFPPFDPYAPTQDETSGVAVTPAAPLEPVDTSSAIYAIVATDDTASTNTVKNFSRPSAIYNPYRKHGWQELSGIDFTVSSSVGATGEPVGSGAATGTIDRYVIDTPASPTTTNLRPSPAVMVRDLGLKDSNRKRKYSRGREFSYGDAVEEDDRWDSGVDTPAEGLDDFLTGPKTRPVESGGLVGKDKNGSFGTIMQDGSRIRDDGRNDIPFDARRNNITNMQRSSHRNTQQANLSTGNVASGPSFHHDRAKGKGPARVYTHDNDGSGSDSQPDDRSPRPLGQHSGPAREYQYVAHDGSIRPYHSLAHGAYSHSESLHPPILRPLPLGPHNASSSLSTHGPERYQRSTLSVTLPAQLNSNDIEAARSSESLGIQPDATYDEMMHTVRYPLDPDNYGPERFRDYDVSRPPSDEPNAASQSLNSQQEGGSAQNSTDGNPRASFWHIVFTSSSTEWPGPAGRIARGGYEAGLTFEASLRRFGRSFYDEMMR